MAGKEGIIPRVVEINKKIDIATVGVGIIFASTPVVLFGMLSYIAGDAVGKRLDKKQDE